MTVPSGGSPTVLLVDDEPSVLSSLTRLLRPDGIRLLSTTSGDEALALLGEAADSVFAVMTDYTMPGMDGATFLHAVSGRWPDITRILLTGNADMPAAARPVNEGRVSRLCTKPWRPDELRQAINEAQVAERTAELESANTNLQRSLMDSVRLLIHDIWLLSLAAGFLDAALAPPIVTQWLQRQYQVGAFDPDDRHDDLLQPGAAA